MLSDLTDELIWPRVLRAPAIALSPNRLITGCVGAFLLILITRFYQLLRDQLHGSELEQQDIVPVSLSVLFDRMINALMALNPVALSDTAIDAATMLGKYVVQNPFVSLLMGFILLVVATMVGGTGHLDLDLLRAFAPSMLAGMSLAA